ncbi:Protein asteroid -like protein 1 [Halotydeus destructor]|nr:Protein asteroid -like protein 1 [Halotydeus destructor]
MGIQCLTKFIRNNSECFTEKFELKDTAVVIDGFALLRFFLVHSREEQLNSQFGGNYVYYGSIISKFFERLKINNVQPYVILEGTEKFKERREETEQRNNIRLQRLNSLAVSSKQLIEWRDNGLDDFYPNLFAEVFKSVLKELKVPCIRTLYNSDSTIALVANQLRCPVLSADSNNYIFDLPNGFINCYSWSFDYDADEELKRGPIQCRIYRRSKLLQHFELKPEVLPFFAVVVGNNYRKRHWDARLASDDEIYTSIKKLNPEKIDRDLNVFSDRLDLIVTLLSWLRRKSRRLAVELFTSLMFTRRAVLKLRDSLDLTIENCELKNALGCALNHLQGKRCTFSHDQEFTDCQGNKQFISEMFAVRFINENWIKDMIQIRMLNRIWAQIEVDDYDKESSLPYLKDILKVLAAISMDGHTESNLVRILDWKKIGYYVNLWEYDISVDASTVEKFHILKQLNVEDKAETLLAILKVSVEDYETSVANLAERF